MLGGGEDGLEEPADLRDAQRDEAVTAGQRWAVECCFETVMRSQGGHERRS